MTNDSKKNFIYYLVLALLALSTVVVTALKVNVKLTAAQGGCNVVVTGDGATCDNGGSNPGSGETDGGSTPDNGNPGTENPGSSSGEDGGNNNNNDDNSDDDASSCSPGTLTGGTLTVQAGSTGLVTSDGTVIPVGSYQLPGGAWVPAGEVPANMCFVSTTTVDSCTGEVYSSQLNSNFMLGAIVSECPTEETHTLPTPCDKLVVTSSGVTCTTDFVDSSSFPGSEWQLTVHTPFPGAEIHTRPFPVTLVNWDTVMRVMGLGSSSQTGHLSYAAWGGGSESSPAAGDWKNVTLRLEIKPIADWADVFLENIGLIRMRIGELHTFQWNLPSHPAAGGGPLAGEVGQLEELEPDVPLYTNWTRAPYMVYCTISYYEWKSTCVGGAGDNGELNCRRDSNGNFTGHREWGWKRSSKTTPITPNMAINQVPAGMLADLNGDGKPDAYWGRLSFIRRMDDAGNVNNPQWAHSYTWGPVWYWGVREGQGQIGWPGVPVP
jgi:hypothetical protein